MATRKFGEPVRIETKDVKPGDDHIRPKINWDLEEKTLQEIEEMEENVRRAESRLGTLLAV